MSLKRKKMPRMLVSSCRTSSSVVAKPRSLLRRKAGARSRRTNRMGTRANAAGKTTTTVGRAVAAAVTVAAVVTATAAAAVTAKSETTRTRRRKSDHVVNPRSAGSVRIPALTPDKAAA